MLLADLFPLPIVFGRGVLFAQFDTTIPMSYYTHLTSQEYGSIGSHSQLRRRATDEGGGAGGGGMGGGVGGGGTGVYMYMCTDSS